MQLKKINHQVFIGILLAGTVLIPGDMTVSQSPWTHGVSGVYSTKHEIFLILLDKLIFKVNHTELFIGV